MKTTKLISIIAIAILATFMLVSCKKEAKTPTVVEILTTMRDKIEFPEMAEIDKKDITLYYQIDAESIDSMSYIVAGSGINTDEVLILKMKDGTDMSEVTNQMGIRQKSQIELFTDYNPDEMPKLETSIIESTGNYAIFAVTNDNKKAKEIFLDSFK